jgi:hypothetical protein
MSFIKINGRLINPDKIHFTRKVSETKLLISFGADHLEFSGTPEELEKINAKLEKHKNEKLSRESEQPGVLD